MPELHSPLKDRERKHDLAIAYKNKEFKPLHVIEDNYNYAIFSEGTITQGVVYLINKSSNRIEYEMHYVTDYMLGLRGVMQYSVWRDPHGEFTKDVVKRVIFEYLLKHYKVVFSDRYQTKSGIELWYKLIPEAIRRGHKVGFINLYNETDDWYVSGPILPWIEKHDAWSNRGSRADQKVFAIAL